MRIRYTKRGQPYTITASGRARFLKKTSAKRRRNKGGYTMAKRRRGFSRGRKGGILTGAVGKLLGAGVYGALRERISNALAPLTSKLPFGDYADEAGILIAAFAVNKFIPKAKIITEPAMVIEAARIGAGLASGIGTGAANTSQIQTYG